MGWLRRRPATREVAERAHRRLARERRPDRRGDPAEFRQLLAAIERARDHFRA